MSIIESSKGSTVGDAAIFTGILLVAGVVLVGSGAVSLPGTQATNFLCSIPLSGSLDQCSNDVQPGNGYKLTTEIEVSRNDITREPAQGAFRYKTSEDPGIALSMPSSSLNFFLPSVENAVVDYTIKDDDGVVIGSGRKHVGELGSFESQKLTFESIVESGTFTVEYVYSYERCQYGGCYDRQDNLRKNVEVPKLPLGEY